MRRILVCVVAVAAVAVVALLWQSDTDRNRRTPAAPTETAQEDKSADRSPAKVAASIAGRVTRVGRPAEARVELWRDHPLRMGDDNWEVDAPTARLSVRSTTPVARTSSGADGRFAFASVRSGAFVVVAIAGDGARAVREVRIGADGVLFEHVDLALPRVTHSLHGKLCYRDGRAIAGFVRAVLADGPLPHRHTADDGAFRLDGLPAGTLSVEAVVPDSIRIIEPHIGVPREGPLLLAIDGRFPDKVRGRVLAYADDAPVAGARVVLDYGNFVFATESAADGSYEVPDVREHVNLSIRARGFAPIQVWGGLKDGVDHRLLPAALVTGRVVRDGDGVPLPNIRVELRDQLALYVATGGDDGTFRFDGVALGEIFFHARGSGWAPKGSDGPGNWPGSETNRFSRFLRAGETAEIEIRMVRAALVEGVVLDESGAPVEGALVRGATAASTDVQGRFALEAPKGHRYHLRVNAVGFAPKILWGLPPFEVRLDRLGVLGIIVESAEGAPIAGARVEARVRTSLDPPDVWWTDATGSVEIAPQPGTDELRVEAEGFVSRKVEVQVAQEPIVLQPAGLVRVRLLLPDGRPAVGAPVTAFSLTDGQVIAQANAAVDGWALLAPPEAERVRVSAYTDHSLVGGSSARWHGEGEAEVGIPLVLTLKRQRERGRDRFDPDENAPRFRLRVLDPKGRPVPAGRVRFRMKLETGDDLFPSAYRFDPTKASVFSFQDGLFEMAQSEWFPFVDKANQVELEILGASATRDLSLGYGHRESTPLPLGPARFGPLPLEGDFELRLPPEQRLAGRVLDADGAPIHGALVWAWPRDRVPGERPIQSPDFGQYDRTRTSHDGRFTLGRLGAEPVAVVVDPPRGFLPSGAVAATPGEALTIKLERGAQPYVSVFDPAGKPLVGASVRVRFSSWNEPFREERPGFWAQDDSWAWRTDEKGVARLGGLEPQRTYRLRVTPPVNRSGLAPEEIQRWKPANTEVSLGGGSTITGVVRDSNGEPRTEAHVYARFANGDGKIVRPNSDGSFKVVNVPAGEVTFTASIDGRDLGADSKAEPLKVLPGARDVVVLIDRPPSVLIRIADWPRDARSSVDLRAHEDEYDSLRGFVDDDGTLEIVGVDPEHTWEVFLGPTSDGRYAWIKNIRPSLEVMDATLVQGGEIRGRLLRPPELEDETIWIRVSHRMVNAYTDLHDDDTFVMRGIPPGTWTICASAELDREQFEVSVEARPGDTIELSLRD